MDAIPTASSAHELSAARAELTYVSDMEPGIRRRRAGKGFTFLTPEGIRLEDAETIRRIKSLAIPPAWTDVWISPDPAGHIQATGRDQKGRKQYRYHPGWTACRDEAKFSSLVDFAQALPKIRDRVDQDLRKRGIPRERVLASIVWLLDHTLIRIGNDTYTKENKSFGLTTLRNKHVEVEGQRIHFSFVGKSGQEWKLQLIDRRIARIVGTIEELPGQHLFQYLDDDGSRRPVHSHDVNEYIHDTAGPDFSSKHFRTWSATICAAILFSEREIPSTKRDLARSTNEVIDKVAARLRNTRAVCRRCYIHPTVIESWEQGRLTEELSKIRRRNRKALQGLDEEESAVLRWLRARHQ